MRAFLHAALFSLSGIGFLLVLAHSWLPSESPVPRRAPAAVEKIERVPAHTAEESFAEIRRLRGCAASGECRLLKSELTDALAVALAEHLTNFGANTDLASEALASGSAIEQVVGLRMLAALPPSPENISALENGMRGSREPALVAGALLELKRYVGGALETDAQRIVEELIAGDARVSSHEVLSPFINEHSYQEFRELLSQLEPSVEARNVLAEALQEYEARIR